MSILKFFHLQHNTQKNGVKKIFLYMRIDKCLFVKTKET